MSTITTLWADALLRASIEGGIAALLVYLMALPLRVRAPRVAVWLWRLVFVKLFLSLFSIGIPMLPAFPFGTVSGQTGAVPINPLPLVIGAASALGLALRIGWFIAERRRILALRRGAVSVHCEQTLSRLNSLCEHLGVTRRPELLVSEQTDGPVLIGQVRPAILLPPALLSDLSEGDLDLVLSHELAHIRARDLAWAWLPALADMLFFFHPLIRLAQRELALAQEIACDQAAVDLRSSERGAYARLLLTLSKGKTGAVLAPAGLMGMSEAFHLLQLRFDAISRPDGSRRVHPAACVAVFGIVVFLFTLSTGRAPAHREVRPLPIFPSSNPNSVRMAAPVAAASIAGPVRFSGERPPSLVGPRATLLHEEVR